MHRTFAVLALLAFTAPALADDPALPVYSKTAGPKSVSALSYAPATGRVDQLSLQDPSRSAAARAISTFSNVSYVPVHKNVNLRRLDPELRRVLNRAARYFGKKVRVTSGYRSPSYNRKVHGALHSFHMKGQAADISIPGVTKKRLAKWADAQPEIGGVGLYCRSSYVHIDTGPNRHWYWPCRKKRHG
jgi:uncharacterized protein YcbK (DUF882 family)